MAGGTTGPIGAAWAPLDPKKDSLLEELQKRAAGLFFLLGFAASLLLGIRDAFSRMPLVVAGTAACFALAALFTLRGAGTAAVRRVCAAVLALTWAVVWLAYLSWDPSRPQPTLVYLPFLSLYATFLLSLRWGLASFLAGLVLLGATWPRLDPQNREALALYAGLAANHVLWFPACALYWGLLRALLRRQQAMGEEWRMSLNLRHRLVSLLTAQLEPGVARLATAADRPVPDWGGVGRTVGPMVRAVTEAARALQEFASGDLEDGGGGGRGKGSGVRHWVWLACLAGFTQIFLWVSGAPSMGPYEQVVASNLATLMELVCAATFFIWDSLRRIQKDTALERVRLETETKLRGGLAATLFHDIKNPLATLDAIVQAQAAGLRPGDADHRSLRRGLEKIRGRLEMAKTLYEKDTGGAEFPQAPVPAQSVFREVQENLMAEGAAARVLPTRLCAQGYRPVLAGPVLGALARCLARVAGKGGLVEMSAAELPGRRVRLRLAAAGRLLPDYLARALEAEGGGAPSHSLAEKAWEEDANALSLAARYCRRMDGRVSLAALEGEGGGTALDVILPLAPEPKDG